jgi:hypothetical protein
VFVERHEDFCNPSFTVIHIHMNSKVTEVKKDILHHLEHTVYLPSICRIAGSHGSGYEEYHLLGSIFATLKMFHQNISWLSLEYVVLYLPIVGRCSMMDMIACEKVLFAQIYFCLEI